jgi:hypothetical protein
MTSSYLAYGLRLRSDVPIPGLSPTQTAEVDVAVWFTEQWIFDDVTNETADPFFPESWEDDSREPTLKAWRLAKNFGYRLKYCDGIEFIIDASGAEIWCCCPAAMTIEDVVVYLLGPVLGFVLRLRGRTCLHASVVCIDDQAVALVGPGGSGKSTTAAAFVQLGWPILTDDVAAITFEESAFFIQPAYPHVRLWPKSVMMLFGHAEALPRLVPVGTWDKCYLDLVNKPELFQTTQLPLRAVYVLGERSETNRTASIEVLSQAEGMMALIANTYANYLLSRSLRGEEFRVLTSIVGATPIKKITPNSDLNRLPELCELIISDFRHSVGGRRKSFEAVLS